MTARNWHPPSTAALRAFEAAARLGSFTKAAEELAVTQGAISHAIRELEARLGTKLFVRLGRTLALSQTGETYLPYVSEALGRLRSGHTAVADPLRRERVLTVSVSPSFAAKWLVPRLGFFLAAHPDLDLRISANPVHIDFVSDEIDVAVRHGDGNWPALDCVELCAETVFPVCSPALMQERPIARPADLGSHTLIHHLSTAAWETWLKAFGADDLSNRAKGSVLNEMSLAIDAAIGGQGVALARSALAARDLMTGALVRPLSEEVPASFSYWIVCPPRAAASAKIVRFRKWLVAEAQQDLRRLGS